MVIKADLELHLSIRTFDLVAACNPSVEPIVFRKIYGLKTFHVGGHTLAERILLL